MPYKIKEAFYSTFRIGEEHSTENTRLSDDEWLSLFREYLRLLDMGWLGQQDKMSEDIYPSRLKKSVNVKYVTCKVCGEEVAEDYSEEGVCRKCLRTGTEYRCKRCGKKLFFSNYDKYVRKWTQRAYCSECYNETTTNSNETKLPPWLMQQQGVQKKNVMTRCVDCGVKLVVPIAQYNASSSKMFICEDCDKKQKKKQKKGCFITTAVCEYRGMSDRCYELQLLRYYRDVWLSHQKEGKQLIEEYYRVAPGIVEKLKESNEYSEYCMTLWEEYIMPCVKMIESGENENCKDLYVKMVRYMEHEFADCEM